MTFVRTRKDYSPDCNHAVSTKLRRVIAQRGASLVEYALLIGIVATVGILAIRSLGVAVSSQFSYTGRVLKGE